MEVVEHFWYFVEVSKSWLIDLIRDVRQPSKRGLLELSTNQSSSTRAIMQN